MRTSRVITKKDFLSPRQLETTLMISTLCLSVALCCNSGCKIGNDSEKLYKVEYRSRPKGDFIIFGVNINKIMNAKFAKIETSLGGKTDIDEERAAVFIKKMVNFVKKNHETSHKDSIIVIFGPIDDVSIYENNRYRNISPNTIVLYGGLKIVEPAATKNNLIKEIRKNLPQDDNTEKIVAWIKEKIIVDNPDRRSRLSIFLDIPSLPTAEVHIGFRTDELFYKFVFATTDDPYY